MTTRGLVWNVVHELMNKARIPRYEGSLVHIIFDIDSRLSTLSAARFAFFVAT
jgi:hypothetical protein